MKTIIFTIIILSIISVQITNAQWVRVSSGMGITPIKSLAVSGNNIFAGTYNPPNGIYLSTNNGTSWLQSGLNNQNVYSLAISGNNIFAGTLAPYNGVYLSTNNGTTWTQTSLNNVGIYSLAVNGNNVFAGDGNGIAVSTNNGATWTQHSEIITAGSLLVNGNNIFEGSIVYNGVYLSTNNGTSWTQDGLSGLGVLSLAANGNNIFAGTDAAGVYISTNNGTSWTQTSIVNTQIPSLKTIGGNIFAGSYNKVYVSNDNGTTWIQRNEGLAHAGNLVTFCILNNYIYAGTVALSGNDTTGVFRRPLGELIAPNVPLLYSPPNNSSGQGLSLNLVWYRALAAITYRVQLCTDSLFNNTIVNDSTVTDSIKAVSGLLNNTTYYWRVNAYNSTGTSFYSTIWHFITNLTGINQISSEIPNEFKLYNNYPNPFNPETIIKIDIAKTSPTQLLIYDVLGREVIRLVDKTLLPGQYEVRWNASNFPSGVYFYKLETESYTKVMKMVLVK